MLVGDNARLLKGRSGIPANSVGAVIDRRGDSVLMNFEDTDLSGLAANVQPLLEFWVPITNIEAV